LSEIFTSMYGFDSVIYNRSIQEMGWKDEKEYKSQLHNLPSSISNTGFLKSDLIIPKKILEFFIKENISITKFYEYNPPSDGFSDEDFINYCRKNDEGIPGRGYRTTPYLDRMAGYISLPNRLYNEFFHESFIDVENTEKLEWARGPGLLRVLELNEFLHRSNDGELLEEFLERDRDHLEVVCSELVLNSYSNNSLNILESRLLYSDFLKPELRDLILKSNKTQIEYLTDRILELDDGDEIDSITHHNGIDLYIEMILESSRIVNSSFKIDIEETLIFDKLLESLTVRNDYSSELKEELLIEFRLLEAAKQWDMAFATLIVEDKQILELPINKVIDFIKKINDFLNRINPVSQMTFLYSALKLKLISIERLLELLEFKDSENLSIWDKPIFNTEYFEIIGDESVPIYWAVDMADSMLESDESV